MVAECGKRKLCLRALRDEEMQGLVERVDRQNKLNVPGF
jgi:hypothetical protein